MTSTPILVILGIVVLAGLLTYAVVQAGKPRGLSSSQAAMFDASADLPGEYYKPHPGIDGISGTGDDRPHVGQGVVVPICNQELISLDIGLDDVFANRSEIGECYNSNPPTSGAMWGQPGAFRIYENPLPKENAIHSMEHGAVVVWYNTTDSDVVEELKDVVEERLDRRRLVVMTQYPGMEPDTIALTAWTRLDKFPIAEFEKERVQEFIEAHQRRFNPEGF